MAALKRNITKDDPVWVVFFRLSKNRSDSLTKRACAALWRLIVCLWQTILTRRSARSIFCHVHAAAKYDEKHLPPAGGKVCDAF